MDIKKALKYTDRLEGRTEAGKGDTKRPIDKKAFDKNYQQIDWSDDGRVDETSKAKKS